MAQLTPRQRAFVRARSKVPARDRTDEELNIIPFLDIVINLIMFLLMVTASMTSYTQVASAMPEQAPNGRSDGRVPSLGLTVVLSTSGIHVATSQYQLGSDCESAAAEGELTIPTRFGAYDWQALRTCVAHVRDAADAHGINFRNASGEAELVLTAGALVEYQSVISAMDALREQDGRSLFPSVLLSAGVR